MSERQKDDINEAVDLLIETCVKLGSDYDDTKEALIDFKLKFNEPSPIIDVSENMQQTKNVIDTQKIIDDELH